MRKVDFARIGGLHLGITSAIENAKLRHPYVYAYHNKRSPRSGPTSIRPSPSTGRSVRCGSILAR
jgi:hypothetical protein